MQKHQQQSRETQNGAYEIQDQILQKQLAQEIQSIRATVNK
jgi:hypothetical protein